MEPGILGASWSPDDSLLALVTGEQNKRRQPCDLMIVREWYSGEDNLILMTSTFDVLSETSLHTSDFGEGVFVSCIALANSIQFIPQRPFQKHL